MFKRLVIGVMVATLTLGLLPLDSALADKPKIGAVSSTCEVLSVDLSNYSATVPANPGQPYIAPTYHTVTIPAVGAVSHDEYKYKATKNNKPTQYTNWVLSAPAPYGQGYSAWIQIDHRVVIDLAATPEQHVQVMDSPGQSYIPATPELTNTVIVDIDSVNVVNTTFSTTYTNTFNYGNKYTAHTYRVVVDGWNGTSKDLTITGTSTPCDNLDHTIDICHANNGINEYVQQNVDYESIIKNNGHAEHQDGRDIIPPFDYVKDGVPSHFDGLNWTTEGQAIYNNGCVVVPDKPADIVGIKTETSVDCETQIVTITVTTTTTGSVLVDNVWVTSEPVITTDVSTREATEQEVTNCTPEKPADVIEVITTEDPADCNKGTVTITVTTTTTGSVLVDNVWVASEPVVTTEVSTRPATDEELVNCSDNQGEVLGDTTNKDIKSLPYTSGDNTGSNGLFMAIPILTFLTFVTMIVRSIIVRRV